MANTKKVKPETHVQEGEDGSMTAVLLLFRVDRGGKAYTLKVERDFGQRKEMYQYTIAREAGIRDSEGDKLVNTWTGKEFPEWTEAIGGGLEAIEKLANELVVVKQ